MLFSTVGQGWVFLWMMAAGALIALWYALLAALRRLLGAGFWLSLGADLLFGAGAAALFCGALATADYGRLRLFDVLGTLAGFGLCAAGLYPPARWAVRRLAGAGRHVCVRVKQFRWIKVIFR